MKTELKKIFLQQVIRESKNSIFYNKKKEFKFILRKGDIFEFIIIDKHINRVEIIIAYNAKLKTIVQFTSVAYTHQYCVISDLERIFTRAFKEFETENE